MTVRTWLQAHGDLLLAVGIAALFTVEILLRGQADLAIALPAAVISGLALAGRRRSPFVTFLVISVLSPVVLQAAPGLANDSIAFVTVFFVSLYSLGRWACGREGWLGVVAVFGYAVAFLLADPENRPPDPGDIGFAVVFVGSPWAVGIALRLRQEREQTLTARNLELQRGQEELTRQAIAAERGRIARELHDVVSHAIAVTVLQARGARKMLGVDDADVRRSLDAIEHTNTQALSDMRRLLFLLRDAEHAKDLRPQPSLQRLDDLVEQVRYSGLPVEVAVSGTQEQVPPGVDLSAYRIIQEALTNTLKHAGRGAHASVEVSYGAEQLELAVVDDGRVERNGHGRGHGLVGIRERVAVAGGQVDVGPMASGGFAVRVRLPYAADS